jgi:predicted GNAT family acetyltransferase
VDGTLRRDDGGARYEWVVDGDVVARMEYRADGDRLVIHHTYTEPRWRGRGIAADLVRAALDDLRTRDAVIVPTCWFVADFVADNPEYAPMLAR